MKPLPLPVFEALVGDALDEVPPGRRPAARGRAGGRVSTAPPEDSPAGA